MFTFGVLGSSISSEKIVSFFSILQIKADEINSLNSHIVNIFLSVTTCEGYSEDMNFPFRKRNEKKAAVSY